MLVLSKIKQFSYSNVFLINQRMWNFMLNNPDVFVRNADEGIKKGNGVKISILSTLKSN
jgi:hypothetical protein